MSPILYAFGVLSALFVLIVVIESLRRQRLRERHAILWLGGGLLALIVSIFPGTLDWIAALIGISVPTNLVFFVSIALLFLVCIQHSTELTTLERKTRALAETVALLELHVREIEEAQQGEDAR
ncbi:DUF2304 domain-containing protein [Protaetiibacter intestinalis]|uniref:DUF2304 domain-containing protein n=1 Tax=Protaetiibacter intestinalis TaxID=2419774 RepID=A0A387B934_9MICO|nr:DUF2304 domain-containing protein [Protaetiibacter intestinalis]AYF98351.1 DUF2304 domain-containing protein [Protaetiibacter intestinalis]